MYLMVLPQFGLQKDIPQSLNKKMSDYNLCLLKSS